MVERLVRQTVTSISAAAAVSALWMISSSMGEMASVVMVALTLGDEMNGAENRRVQ